LKIINIRRWREQVYKLFSFEQFSFISKKYSKTGSVTIDFFHFIHLIKVNNDKFEKLS